MDIDRLHHMLVQRGYNVASDDERLYILLGTGTLILLSSQIGLLTEEQWKPEIDALLAQGQHHMEHSCGRILLRDVAGETTRYYIYRDVQVGPVSSWIWECPNCHEELREDGIHEVQD